MRLMTRETFAFGLCRDVCDLKFARARIVDALENIVVFRSLGEHGVDA